MFQHSIAFDHAAYLLLLGLLPLVWRLGSRSLAGLGRWRRGAALVLRSLVLVLLVLALAEAQYQRKSDRLAVIYALDQSLSIPAVQRQAMIEYVNASIKRQFEQGSGDRYAVIVFGRDASVELPMINASLALPGKVETVLDPEYSDLATAIQRAKAMFPYDAAKRIVLVTDGNENLGDARREARAASSTGISIDVVPVWLSARSEVSVEKIDVPAEARRGQPFEMRVVLDNDSPPASDRAVEGELRILRKNGEREEEVVSQHIRVPPGKRVFTIPEQLDQADFFTYEARFTPDDPAADGMAQNNQASAFTHVRGKGQVLLIENWDRRGEFDYLVERLRSQEIAVTLMPSDRLFTSLAELQRYDSVVLANLSRTSGDDADTVASFSDEQISMLERNTREMGCGLVMLGGSDSFGAGGWTNTELEKAMPVDFEIKNSKVVPVGALVLMMHAGEMPQSNYWQKRIASESIKTLGSRDYCGMVQWNGRDVWLWGQTQEGLIRVGPNRKMMLARTDQMQIGDMPAFDPALKMAATAFAGVPDAAVKHMIVISDGDPTSPTAATINRLVQQAVKVSTVAVGSHGTIGSPEMRNIATRTGGKYYVVKNANALPKIYQREARRIARPLVYEADPPVVPQVDYQNDILAGIEGGVPPVSGFVLTTVKDNPLVEVIMRSPQPVTEKNSTLMATWIYGAGKSAVLTTDAGNRWANRWTEWDGYDKLFSNLVRWSMRPTDDTANFSIASDVRDGKTQVVITALDAEDEFLNDLAMSATVVAPDMSTVPVRIQQTAPGRYVGEFLSEAAGSYLIVVNPGGERAPLRTGVNIGYSAEYRENETNEALLQSLLEKPGDAQPAGNLVETGLDMSKMEELMESNPFRHDLPPALANEPIWPNLLVLASCLFFADVFVRRVQVNWQWLTPLWGRVLDKVLRRQPVVKTPETMSRLRSRKQEIGQQIESRRSAARYEGPHVAEAPPVASLPTTKETPAPSQTPPPETESPPQESYTERLLKAKKQVWQDRNPQDKKPDDRPGQK
jgi:uncharacterized membrane protein